MTEVSLSFVGRIGAAFTQVVGGLADKTPSIAAALVVIVLTWLAGRITFAATRRVLSQRSTAAHVDVFVARFARAGVIALGLVVSLGIVGVDLTALVASLGLVGLTLGFALRDVLANSVSGVLLLLQRPFTIGDSIAVAGVEGPVEDIRVRDTVVRLADGRRAYVPNTTVFNEVVINASHDKLRRFEVCVTVPAGMEPLAALEQVRMAVSAVPDVLPEPEPDAVLSFVGSTRARIVAHGWVDTGSTGLDGARSAALLAASVSVRGKGAQTC